MDFALAPDLFLLRDEIRTFMDARVLPKENDIIREDGAGEDGALKELQQEARKAGLFVPHLPAEYGGRGLGILGMCTLFREMGRSPVGARVFNCDAPDQGNMDLLLGAASPALQERYLRPLVQGEVRSCFAMSEPHPGAGSDPAALMTAARRVDGGWVIDGDKRFISGADGAAFAIAMARTPQGATMFLVEDDNPGFQVGRRMPATDTVFAGGH